VSKRTFKIILTQRLYDEFFIFSYALIYFICTDWYTLTKRKSFVYAQNAYIVILFYLLNLCDIIRDLVDQIESTRMSDKRLLMTNSSLDFSHSNDAKKSN